VGLQILQVMEPLAVQGQQLIPHIQPGGFRRTVTGYTLEP
jgi:hypothetical protein